MPKETHIAARNSQGEEFLYHENPYPPANVVELFEKYSPGAARELLEMAKIDQRNSFTLANRASRTKTLRVVLASVLAGIFMACGTFLVYTGHWIAGGANVLVALISLFVIIATGESQQGIRR